MLWPTILCVPISPETQCFRVISKLFKVQTKISSYVHEKWFNNWYVACIYYYLNYSYNILEAWSTIIRFPDKFGIGGIRFSTNSLPLEDPIIKAWGYGMVAYFLEIPNPENPFFQSLTKFQKCV